MFTWSKDAVVHISATIPHQSFLVSQRGLPPAKYCSHWNHSNPTVRTKLALTDMNTGRNKTHWNPNPCLAQLNQYVMSVYNNHETLLLCPLFFEVNTLILKSDWTNGAVQRIYGNYNQLNNIKGYFLLTLIIFNTLGIWSSIIFNNIVLCNSTAEQWNERVWVCAHISN